MPQLETHHELIQELKGNVEALSCLVYALAETMTDEQLQQLPTAFRRHTQKARMDRLGDSNTSSSLAFNDKVTEIKTTLLFEGPDEAQ